MMILCAVPAHKRINAAVLPKLYKKVFIKVPQRWSRLPSLDGLLASTGSGLNHTTELFVQTQQDPLRDGQQRSEDSWSTLEVRAQMNLQFYVPQSSVSNALNYSIRNLIVKLPRDRLKGFQYVSTPSDMLENGLHYGQ